MNYTRLTVSQLKDQLIVRGYRGLSRKTKAELVEMLTNSPVKLPPRGSPRCIPKAELTVSELRDRLRELNVRGYSNRSKVELQRMYEDTLARMNQGAVQ